jgi:exopolysaccharide biosynthesis protein
MKKGVLSTVAFILALTAFTAYLLLDTFIIAREGDAIVSMGDVTFPTRETSGNEPSGTSGEITLPQDWEENFTDEAVWTDNSYTDKNISVKITEYREHDTTIYVADVRLASVEYLKTALAKGKYGSNIKEKTSVMAKNNDAILAVNGDYYGARRAGFVIRQGVLYRESAADEREALAIFVDGSFSVVNEENSSARELLAAGAYNVLSFGPSLIVDGKVTVGERDEVDQSMANNPRTAIAYVEPLHYLIVVSDGRTSESKGLKLYQMANFLRGLGAAVAYNLDGGGSSTMYFGGKVINNPTTNGKKISEREVSDIVYVGY